METRSERRKRTIHRIHRIQGQLEALEKSVLGDHDCEDLVLRARTIEKATASLIRHMFRGYLLHQVKDVMRSNPDDAADEVAQIFRLITK